jgi:hypothetical protein
LYFPWVWQLPQRVAEFVFIFLISKVKDPLKGTETERFAVAGGGVALTYATFLVATTPGLISRLLSSMTLMMSNPALSRVASTVTGAPASTAAAGRVAVAEATPEMKSVSWTCTFVRNPPPEEVK